MRGAKVALARQHGRAGGLRIRAVYLDDTGGRGRWDPVATAANARRAAEDSSAIGYIGELDSGATRVSLPITNQAEMIQISPGATAVDLTREAYGGPDPDIYRPSGDQTFARIVPADDVQARAAALLAKELGARRIAVVRDGSQFGRTIGTAFRETAISLGIDARPADRPAPGEGLKVRPVASADAVYFAGTPSDAAFVAMRSAAPSADALIVPDAFLPDTFPSGPQRCTAILSRQKLYGTSSFRDPSRLPARARGFLGSYRARYGAPPPAAAYGFEAMSLLFDAIVGPGGDSRHDVIDAVLSTRDRDSVIGAYSIDGSGDTTLDTITSYDLGCPLSFDRELRAPR